MNAICGLLRSLADHKKRWSAPRSQEDFAPVFGPGAFEVRGVVARLDGCIDAYFADDAIGIRAFERRGGGVINGAAGARPNDDVARRIGAWGDGVIDETGV